MKTCDVEGCNYPVFRQDKNTGKRYCASHSYRFSTDIDKRSALQKHMDKLKAENKTASVKTRVRGLINTSANKVVKEQSDTRNELMMLADRLFSNYIKSRDADNNGNIECVCCGKLWNLEDKDDNGKKIVQPLHFISRSVYSLRFSEINTHAGCCYCNNDMDKNELGRAHGQYRAYLISTVGIEEVKAMELEKRNINRMTHADIQEVINKYNPKNSKI